MNTQDFNEIPNNARVWIFASPDQLNDETAVAIQDRVEEFLSKWKAHGKELKSYSKFIDNHFLVITVDENFAEATGCSIDTLMHLIFEIESKYSVKLTDRSLVFFKQNNIIKSTRFTELRKLVQDEVINVDTLIFDNSVSQGIDLKENWIKQASNSWISKFFNNSFV